MLFTYFDLPLSKLNVVLQHHQVLFLIHSVVEGLTRIENRGSFIFGFGGGEVGVDGMCTIPFFSVHFTPSS